MIYLKNPGLIDLNTIKIMGINIKEFKDSIGIFGTGLKYAIATFLRHNIDFKMYRGNDEFLFFTESKTIRDEEINICYMQGPHDRVELNFTENLGLNWELWQAYREIHANCLDEKGEIFLNEKPSFNENSTIFSIDLDINPNDIFLNKDDETCIFCNENIEIYEGQSNYIFYQSIRARNLIKPSLYTYNIKKTMQFNRR